MKLPVTIDFSGYCQGKGIGDTLAILHQAIALTRKPRSWRLADYAMTKADAQQALYELERQSSTGATTFTIAAFDWSVLLGEVARLRMDAPDIPEGSFGLYDTIRAALIADERTSQVMANVEECDRLRRRIACTRKRLKALKRSLREQRKPPVASFSVAFTRSPTIDPEATLRRAEDALDTGDLSEAQDALADYRRWRGSGGFEPTAGDDRAKRLHRRLRQQRREPGQS